MTKTITQIEQVAVFMRYQSKCAVGDVSAALNMADGIASVYSRCNPPIYGVNKDLGRCRLLSRKHGHLRKKTCDEELPRCIQKCSA